MNSSIRILFLFLCGMVLTSCKVNRNLLGNYNSTDLGNWQLNIQNDSLFNFIGEDYKALLTKNEPFFYTVGTWIRNGDTLLLTSKPNVPDVLGSKVETEETSDNKSTFMFFNFDGDTLKFNSIYKNQELFMFRVHGGYSNIQDKVENGDILNFDFFSGYNPFTITISDSEPRIYRITISGEKRSDYFKNYVFLIKNKRLIDPTKKRKYKKINGL